MGVDGQHRVDLVVAGGGQHALVGDRRVGDAVVEPAEPGRHPGDEAADRRGVGDVELLGDQAAGVGGGQGGEGRGARAGERGHGVAPGEEMLDQGEAQAAGAAGDQGEGRGGHGVRG